MNMTRALEGFLFTLKVEGYSLATIDLYRIMLTTLTNFLGDREVSKIAPNDLTRYFGYLRGGYIPRRQGGNDAPLSGSTLRNHWKAIRCFFRWAEEEFSLKSRPDARLKLPPNNPREIKPLSEEDVKILVEGTKYTRQAATNNRRSFMMKRPIGERDKALIILLLDTGIRSGEASRLDIKDVDLNTGEIFIVPYGSSIRKTKSRVIPIGKATRHIVWRYLSTRPEASQDDPLFITISGWRMNSSTIRLLLKDMGDKAGIRNCHPHRLRHTFAVEYLRNDGDIFTLQMILGHSSLDMVRHYLQLVKADAKNAHRHASPADKWRM
jgi:integrase/recombinase XerD